MADGSSVDETGTGGATILRRKAEAGRHTVAAARQITPGKALSSAVVQAADARLDMVVAATSSTARTGTLSELLDTVPEGGLLAVLEGPGDGQGLMALDAAMLSTLIEKTMTGRLSTRPPASRRPTRTDAALTADLIDDVLRRFEAPFMGTSVARWAGGFGYSSFLDDPRPLGLMLEDIDYRILSLAIDVENGTRSCALLLAVPAEGRGAIGRPVDATGGGEFSDMPVSPAAPAPGRAPLPPPEPEEQLPWGEALERRVMAGRVSLGAVLYRFDMPIAALETLKVGLELPLPASSLDECALIGSDGLPVAHGRLGQSRNMRAVRLASPAVGGADTPQSTADTGQQGGPARAGAPFETAGLSASEPPGELPPPGPVPLPPGPSPMALDTSSEIAGGAGDDLLAGLPPPPDLPDLPGLPDLPEIDGDAPGDLPDLPGLPPLT